MSRAFDWKFWIGLVISAVFLYIALRQVDLERLWGVMRSAAPAPLGLAVLITLAQYPARAFRWGVLLAPIRSTGFRNRVLATLVGFASNCLLPARLGEFVRANYLGVSEGISGSAALGTVVIERLFDGLTLLIILVLGLALTRFPPEYEALGSGLEAAGYLIFGVYLLIILLLAGFKWKSRACLGLLERLLFFLPQGLRSRLTQMAWNFSVGIVLLRGHRSWSAAVLYSAAVWILGLLQVKAVALSLGLPISFTATFMILATASLGVMIPSAPGFIGTFHLAVQYGFLIHGVNPEEALSAAILLHASFFIPTVIAGAVAFFMLHVPWSRLAHGKETAD